MSVPAEGFKYNKCSFKPDDKIKIDKILSYIQEKLDSIGMSDFYESGIGESLDLVSHKNLYEISSSWGKLCNQLEFISFKMEVVYEYRMIKKLVETTKEKVIQISAVVKSLEEDLRKDYSNTISSNSFFSDYFSYKEFKSTFESITGEDTVSIKSLSELKGVKMFEFIRRRIISDRANIHSLLSDQSRMVHINEIKKEDEKTFELLRSEFFTTLCNEALKIRVSYGTKSQTEIIRPSHPMAKMLKLERTEIAYMTVSLDPVPDLEFEIGQVVEFNNGMKFNVIKNQQVVEREMFYKIPLEENTHCNLIVPFFFSFIRCNLVKEQRSSYSKINDNSMIEEVSGKSAA